MFKRFRVNFGLMLKDMFVFCDRNANYNLYKNKLLLFTETHL